MSQPWGWTWVTQDAVVTPKSAQLSGAILVASSAGTATATLYSGRDTSGRLIVTLSAPASEMGPFQPAAFLLCDGGIYVDVGSNVTGVLVIWRQAKSPIKS